MKTRARRRRAATVQGRPVKGSRGSRGSRIMGPPEIRRWARTLFRAACREHGITWAEARERFGLPMSARRIGNEWTACANHLPAFLETLGLASVRQLPATRGECPRSRPCPYVSCRHHMYLDVTPGGGIQFNFPRLEVWELPETCGLDAGGRGWMTLDETGRALNLTRERVRQVELAAMDKLRRRLRGCREG